MKLWLDTRIDFNSVRSSLSVQKIAKETPEQRVQRLVRRREQCRERRARETGEQRKERLAITEQQSERLHARQR